MDVEDKMLEQARTAPFVQERDRYVLRVDDLLDYEGTAAGYDGGGTFSAVVRFGKRTWRSAGPEGWLYDVEHDTCAGDERDEEEPLATLADAQDAAREQLVDHIEDWASSLYVNIVSSYGEHDQDGEDWA
jgi:hypothetical protein